ncbi:MAG: hypothetical protein GY737_06925 [Desulfobacteraceae bacterium]|nr:hypothetical protein [Desulfobacteraceae bacterium]
MKRASPARVCRQLIVYQEKYNYSRKMATVSPRKQIDFASVNLKALVIDVLKQLSNRLKYFG